MSRLAPSLGLYLSVPFCRAKCSFCNFASGVSSAEAIELYVAELCHEIRQARVYATEHGADLPDAVDTVYFGGGTPSLLEPHQFHAIMEAIEGEFALEAGAEITLEAAPGQISDALLDQALREGVNRASLGVQSFVDREAQAVGRSHTQLSCLAEFARLQHFGVPNVGADLIAGLPYQTEASWQQSLKVATECGLAHLSVYMLEIDEESRLGREVLGGGARLHAPAVASEEVTAALYEMACEQLPAAGYRQYEISNFAVEAMQSKHNSKYWTRSPYLGLGLDAHSMLLTQDGQAVRWANPDELRNYTGASSTREVRTVSDRESFEEEVFLGLRLTSGLELARLQPYRTEWVEELKHAVKDLASHGLMSFDAERVWLTSRGRIISGEIFGELLTGAPA